MTDAKFSMTKFSIVLIAQTSPRIEMRQKSEMLSLALTLLLDVARLLP
jgi:hypothetical protein